LKCSLGCTFCTRSFTSSSSVKRKLKTIPEGQGSQTAFFSILHAFFSPTILLEKFP